jgi:multiple sugar transport system substrate-binding protein|tara:strand:- start:412 stop:846 length:435 start_codon:yes stop_codon:yes gene_type:complete
MINDKELLLLIDHINTSLSLFKKKFKKSNFETDWKIFSFCIKNQIQNKLTNVTSLINISGLPHSTGLRRINKLIDEKKLIKKSRTNSGKSFSIHPSSKLIEDLVSYLTSINNLLESKSFNENQTDRFPTTLSLSSRYVLYPRMH